MNLKELTESYIVDPASLTKENADVFFKELFLNLESGNIRVCEKNADEWIVNEWVKKAILLFFKTTSAKMIGNGFDKIPLKTENWNDADFKSAGFRVVPGSIIRSGCHIGSSVVVMPSFINIGAYIGSGTMVDSFATVGSCAQIGMNVHLSSNVVVGGVLEPTQAQPVIIEDNCFIGAGSCVLEGMIVEEGAVIGAGVHLSATTRILDRTTGLVTYGRIPKYSVVVPGTYPTMSGYMLGCAVVVKQVDEKTRQKTAINDLLRDH